MEDNIKYQEIYAVVLNRRESRIIYTEVVEGKESLEPTTDLGNKVKDVAVNLLVEAQVNPGKSHINSFNLKLIVE